MEDSLWDDEVRDFVNTLQEAGITEFVVTSRSSGLMEDLYAYTAEGCTMQGLYNGTRRESRFGEVSEENIYHNHFRFSIPTPQVPRLPGKFSVGGFFCYNKTFCQGIGM